MSACAGSLLKTTQAEAQCWVVEVRENSTDVVEFEKGIPLSIQHLNWGWNALKAGLEKTTQESLDCMSDEAVNNLSSRIQEIDDSTLLPMMEPLIEGLNQSEGSGPFITAIKDPWQSVIQSILQRLLPAHRIESHLISNVEGASHPTQTFYEKPPPVEGKLQIELTTSSDDQALKKSNRTPYLRWAALLGLLIIVALLARRIEPSLRITNLEAQLEKFHTEKEKLPELDRELSFMEYIAQKSMPYMDLVSLIAAQSVPGFHLESLEMGSDRHMQLRGTLPQNSQPEDLRAKLLATSWFEQVVLDEQTPDKNRRDLTIRMSLIVKDHLKRPTLNPQSLGLETETTPAKASK